MKGRQGTVLCLLSGGAEPGFWGWHKKRALPLPMIQQEQRSLSTVSKIP